jgi:hypothetical protein
MKKLFTLIGIAAFAAVVIHTSFKLDAQAQTYTNGFRSPRLDVSDQQWEQLKVLRKLTEQTNVAMADFAASNLVVDLSPQAKQMIRNLKSEISQKVATCDDESTLIKIRALLDAASPPAQ